MTEKNRPDSDPGGPAAGHQPGHPSAPDTDKPPVVQTPDPAGTPELPLPTGSPADPAADGPMEQRTQPPVDDTDGPTRPLRPQNAEPAPAEPAPESAEPVPAEPAPESAESVPAGAASTGASLERVKNRDGAPAVPDGERDEIASAEGPTAPWRRLSSAGALIWVLLALFGFTLVVQLRSNDGDQGLATARQEDLVRILSDLEARDSRLQSEIAALEVSQRQLTSGVAGRQAALAEADKRADELGLLAGTLPARGPGLRLVMSKVKASAVLNAVQELRGAGGEVMQIAGVGGGAVRIVASSYFVDADGGGLVVDGVRLSSPYVLDVIGSPQTMQTALQIPGGVVASVNSGGGSVAVEQRSLVEVTALRKATTLQYARPVS